MGHKLFFLFMLLISLQLFVHNKIINLIDFKKESITEAFLYKGVHEGHIVILDKNEKFRFIKLDEEDSRGIIELTLPNSFIFVEHNKNCLIKIHNEFFSSKSYSLGTCLPF